MMKTGRKNKNAGIMLGVLQGKSISKKEWRETCIDLGVNIKTFYYNFSNLKKNGQIKHTPEGKAWMPVKPGYLANHKEIMLYVDQMRSENDVLRRLGADELVNLCKSKVVTHDPFMMRFFETSFRDESFKDIHSKLLEAFENIILRNLKEDKHEIIAHLMGKHKDAIMGLAKSGSPKLESDAINVLRFCPCKDVLDLLYEKIEYSEKTEYDYIREAIRDCLKSFSKDNKVEMKRRLFKIATAEKSDETIRKRAVDLLVDLSGLEKKFLA
jgi:hypothetical protein